MMQQLNLPDLIEECLTQLQHGAGLEDVLLHYPQQAAVLRPLLEAATLAFLPLTPAVVPAAAQYRSRTQLLATTRLMHPAARPAPECPRFARGMVTFAATSARQSYLLLAGQRRSRRCPAERKGRGGGRL